MPTLVPTESLLRPVTVGGIVIDPPLVLAPMAGQTNHAFRTLCRDMGGVGLVVTEFLSSHAMQFESTRARTLQLFDWRPEEFPFAVQLFGNDPQVMADAARLVVDHGAAMVDINMGCWVPKVVKKGGGAALLRDQDKAAAVVAAVVAAVPVPVTVKVRSGFCAGEITAVDFARAARDVGVQAVAVHARYADQGFNGAADWSVIRAVKAAVPDLPVFGNGDVFTADDARQMLESTGADGVMVGRAALGNPWVFAQITRALRGAEALPLPTPRQRAEACLTQAQRTLATTQLPQRQALLELRGQLAKYMQHLPADSGPGIRAQIVRAESLADIEVALKPLLAD